MKIEEARQKECKQMPIYIQPTSDANLIDAGSVEFFPSLCSANQCMHWRWHLEVTPKEELPKEIDVQTVMLAALGGAPRMRLSKTNGYCGLCGKEGAE